MANSLKPSGRRRPVFIADFRGPALGEGSDLSNASTRLSDGQPTTARRITSGDVEELDGISTEGKRPGLRIVRDGLRYNFPPAGPVAEGGISDGYRYHVPFAAGRLDRTYALILAFLKEQGYGGLPLPVDVEELKQFRLPPKLRHQLSLFGEDGYVHNPVKILFPTPSGRRGALILELYDECAEGHLLRFHRR